MPPEAPHRPVEAVVFDLDDVVVPFHTVRAFQWAWKPQGPVLGERRAQSALRRALHAWDRRRWLGLTGKAPPTDAVAFEEHLAAALREVAGHALPPAETDAVVRRLLRPAGEVERYPDVAAAFERLARAEVKVGILTPLPRESARWLLHRVGLGEELLLGAGDPPGPAVPAREAFRSAGQRLGVPLARTAFVGDLYWSDARAAARAGFTGILLDRSGAWPHIASGRVTTLADLETALASRSVREGAVASPGPATDAAGVSRPGDFL